MAFTFSQLKTAIQNELEEDSTEFVDYLDDIIALAEQRIYREANLNRFYKNATVNLTISVATAAVPSDFILARYLQLADSTPLISKDESFVREQATASGTPKYWAFEHDGTNFLFWPTPSSSTSITLGYIYRPTGLSDSNTTSWLSNNASDVLLYACILAAAPFIRMEVQDAQRYASLYERALQALKAEEEIRRKTDQFRSGDKPATPVT